MRQCNNLGMIEQIYIILQKISLGIIQAEEVLQRTEEINSSVEIQVRKSDLIRLEISELTTHNQQIENNIQRLYIEIQNIHQHLTQELSAKPNKQTLHFINPEFHDIFNRLNEIQLKMTQLDQDLTNCNLPLAQNCDLLHQLLSQIEEDKQAIIDLAQNLENRIQRVNKLQTELEQVLIMKDHLDGINSEIFSLALEVRNNQEALNKIQNSLDNARSRADNSLWELRGEIENLRETFEYNYRDIKSKFQTQIKNQQRIDNWLFCITFIIVFLAIVWFLSH